MQRRGLADQADVLLLKVELFCEQRGGMSDALGVLERLVVAVLGGEREPAQRLEAGLLEFRASA